jgi:hypothetical protein
MQRKLFVKDKKKNVIYKEMKPTRWKPIVKEI